jgi:hypothetical protein
MADSRMRQSRAGLEEPNCSPGLLKRIPGAMRERSSSAWRWFGVVETRPESAQPIDFGLFCGRGWITCVYGHRASSR